MLVPYYAPEPLSERCEALIVSLARPVISDLCEVELTSALARKVRRDELSRPNAERIKEAFHSHIEGSYYRLLPVERHHFRRARDWIAQFKSPLSSLDGLHVAVASALGIPLATADRTLAACAGDFGLKVLFLS